MAALLHKKASHVICTAGQEDSALHIIHRQQQSDRLGPHAHEQQKKYDSATQSSMFPWHIHAPCPETSEEDREEETLRGEQLVMRMKVEVNEYHNLNP